MNKIFNPNVHFKSFDLKLKFVIYGAYNTSSQKLYIGQTTKKLLRRKACHLQTSKSLKNKQYFHKALFKNSDESCWIWGIIKICLNKKDLDKWEKYYIKKWKTTNCNSGYNLTTGGSGNYRSNFSRKLTKEAIKKISDFNKNRKFNDSHCKNLSLFSRGYKRTKKAILQAKKTLKINNKIQKHNILCITNGKIYQSVTEAAKKLKLQRTKISAVLSGRRKSTGGLVFVTLNNNTNFYRPTKRKIICIDTNQEFFSIKEASNILCVDRSSIHKVLCGKQKFANGLQFIYKLNEN